MAEKKRRPHQSWDDYDIWPMGDIPGGTLYRIPIWEDEERLYDKLKGPEYTRGRDDADVAYVPHGAVRRSVSDLWPGPEETTDGDQG